MMKSIKTGLWAVLALLALSSCKKDDDGGGGAVEVTPPRDRGEVQVESDEQITSYLKTHTYNYEEFATPPEGFDYKIKLDSIAGDFVGKTPLMDMDSLKVATYKIYDVDYKLYTLVVREGAGKQASYADSVFVNYKGNAIYKEVFDEAINPVWFDLPGYFDPQNGFVGGTVTGFSNAMDDFKGASTISQNEDGTLAFSNDYGIGAVFIPSGLGYFNNASAKIPAYSNLIYKIYVFDSKELVDADGDGVPNIVEDLNGNKNFMDDDTSGNGLPNFVDPDDDGDGIPTRDEIEIKEDGTIIYTDTDGDGVPNYLDDDDDGDGIPTRDEIKINSSTGKITYPDSNGNGIPDYLDKTS